MLLSEGSLGIFYSNGLVGTLVTVALLLLAWSFVSPLLKRRVPPAQVA
jgi:TctA family transporter